MQKKIKIRNKLNVQYFFQLFDKRSKKLIMVLRKIKNPSLSHLI